MRPGAKPVKAVLALVSAGVAVASIVPAGARGGEIGSGGGGGTTVPSCSNDVTNVAVASGGNRGGHTVVPNSMHVFVEYVWRPCVAPFERVDVIVTDRVTGVVQAVTPASFEWGQYGGLYKMAHHTSDAAFNHPYDVVIRTSNQATGEVVTTVSRSIVTDKKL